MTIENKNIDFLFNDLTIDLYNLYKKSSFLAIDTEAMGLIHGRDRLCLVQICNEFKRTSCIKIELNTCLLYTSPSPRDKRQSRMPSSA